MFKKLLLLLTLFSIAPALCMEEDVNHLSVPIKPLAKYEGHTCRVSSVEMEDGELVSRSEDGHVCIWNSTTGEELSLDLAEKLQEQAFYKAPDGKKLFFRWSNIIKVKSPNAPSSIECKGHTKWVSSVCVTPDKERIVSGAQDATVRVWDIGTGKQLAVCKGHTECTFACVSSDGNYIVSCSYDNTVRVWDVKSGAQLGFYKGDEWLKYTSVCFTSHNKIAVGASDCCVHIFSLEWFMEKADG